MTPIRDLSALVSDPREAIDLEVKGWLDLSDGDSRAALAKEIIALANQGGGFVIAGFLEKGDGTFVLAENRPEDLGSWSQDAIQSIVAKYIDPLIQCRVSFEISAENGLRFPVIGVPGGHRVPVRAKASSPNGKKLVAQRTYIRRPGPSSEEPQAAIEWDALLERCLQNRKEDLLSAMRSIMDGVIPTVGENINRDQQRLLSFEQDSIALWESLVKQLSPQATPRFLHGYYDLSFVLEGNFDKPTISKLRQIIEQENRNHSGWPPFLTLNRVPYMLNNVNGAVQFWRGPETDGRTDAPAKHDFWRISPDGYFFTRCGYWEDSGVEGTVPGKGFDISIPIWRLGEAILQVSYIAKALSVQDTNLTCHARWTSLANRSFVTGWNPRRVPVFGLHKATQDDYETTGRIAMTALPDSLPELVHDMLAPLYELFNFFALPKIVVEQEISLLRSRTF